MWNRIINILLHKRDTSIYFTCQTCINDFKAIMLELFCNVLGHTVMLESYCNILYIQNDKQAHIHCSIENSLNKEGLE